MSDREPSFTYETFDTDGLVMRPLGDEPMSFDMAWGHLFDDLRQSPVGTVITRKEPNKVGGRWERTS